VGIYLDQPTSVFHKVTDTYSVSQVSAKCQSAFAPVRVLLTVLAGSWLEKVPGKTVPFCVGMLSEEFAGVITRVLKSNEPLTRVSYEYPVWTG
jgi:hypothetical protein